MLKLDFLLNVRGTYYTGGYFLSMKKTHRGIGVFFVVPVILVGVALVAVWLPATRASRISPIHALQYE